MPLPEQKGPKCPLREPRTQEAGWSISIDLEGYAHVSGAKANSFCVAELVRFRY